MLEEFPDAVILRPSIVFGPEDQFFNRFANLARMAPLMPLVGGKTKFQPVYVGDLAQAILAAANGAATPATIYEIGGAEIATFRSLLERTQTWSGRNKPYFPMPFWLANICGSAAAKNTPIRPMPSRIAVIRVRICGLAEISAP